MNCLWDFQVKLNNNLFLLESWAYHDTNLGNLLHAQDILLQVYPAMKLENWNAWNAATC